MKNTLLIGFLLACGLWSSCTEKAVFDVLDKAESSMETHPDSALFLLHHISHPGKLRGKQRADYALLLTQARDKNYLDSLQSDSLIGIAVDYYKDRDDDVKAGKSLFYYGKVAALQDKDTLAMQAYLDALARLEKTGEYKLRGLVYEYIGRINDARKMHDMALENYRKSISCYQRAHDTLGIAYIYRNIAWIYEGRHEQDSVRLYVDLGISALNGDSLSPAFPSLMHLKGVMESNSGNYSEAMECFRTAIRHERGETPVIYYCTSPEGDSYAQQGRIDEAEKCFQNILSWNKGNMRFGGYHYLYLLEKRRGKYKRALSFKEKSDSLLQVVQDERLRSGIRKLQQEYEVEKLRLEAEVLRKSQQMQLLGGMVLLVFLISAGAFTVYKILARRKYLYEKRLYEAMRLHKEVISVNEKTIEEYQSRIENLKRAGTLAEDTFREQIGKLEREIQVLVNKNQEARENSYAGGRTILLQLRGHLLVVENMTLEEKRQLFAYMDLLFDNFATHLRNEYKLKDGYLLLATFMKLGFSFEELMAVFDCGPEAIRKRKQRLKEKLELDSTINLYVFLTFYPRKMSC
ncbi:tetratricopeptide repeat protein [Bacteroides fluxus]|uniref:Tetratricopeptide repeat protein n=1 Tax=Bacteroides fluxus YIT 12057 TaxID=763034 RepID=F3PWM4_9BACE|nr:hypothetical protein [Bacteroides fluxus]EGF51953.1 tetratricopeptide repeat protein [Bacteroides fluxus YIT 12057]